MSERSQSDGAGRDRVSPEQHYQPKNDYIGAYTAKFQLDRAKAALVVVDMQYATGHRHTGLGKRMQEQGREDTVAYRFDRIERVVVPGIATMLDFCREHGVRIVYVVIGSDDPDFLDMPPHMRALARDTNNRVGSRENEIIDDLKPKDGEIVVRKTTISAFTSTGIDLMLRSMGVEQLLFTGVSTNMCVETTARDAADRGYQCVLIEDCLGAAQQAYHDATLVTFQRLFGRVLSSDEVRRDLIPARERVMA